MNYSSQKPKKTLIQEELERRILHGLACEWEGARWMILNSSDRDKLHKPFFSLRDMNGKWGYWSEEKNEICLSRKLVINHSWGAVREILLHEMAHQFAEQVLCASNEPPHGPKFKRACYLLRANPKASGNYRPLDELVLHDSTGPEDKIMIRVKKLMALAQSQNLHEAEAAMAKAHEFIAKYNVDLLARGETRHFVSVFVGTPALRHFREDYHLSSLLQDYYFVYGIWVPAYVMEKGKMGRVLEINGTVQNVKIANYVYGFVRHFIDSHWHAYNKDKGLNRYRKTDFAVGIIEGFRSKLKLQTGEEKNIKSELALVKIQDPLLENHIDYKYPHTASVRGKALRKDKHVLKDGISVGKELVIFKGITEKGKSRRLLT
jgi:predicted SprT family Zn-dependent metalloprotease